MRALCEMSAPAGWGRSAWTRWGVGSGESPREPGPGHAEEKEGGGERELIGGFERNVDRLGEVRNEGGAEGTWGHGVNGPLSPHMGK